MTSRNCAHATHLLLDSASSMLSESMMEGGGQNAYLIQVGGCVSYREMI